MENSAARTAIETEIIMAATKVPFNFDPEKAG